MIEIRFNALKANGQVVSGTLSVPTYKEGKEKVHQLIEKNKLKLKSIEKKSTQCGPSISSQASKPPLTQPPSWSSSVSPTTHA